MVMSSMGCVTTPCLFNRLITICGCAVVILAVYGLQEKAILAELESGKGDEERLKQVKCNAKTE